MLVVSGAGHGSADKQFTPELTPLRSRLKVRVCSSMTLGISSCFTSLIETVTKPQASPVRDQVEVVVVAGRGWESGGVGSLAVA